MCGKKGGWGEIGGSEGWGFGSRGVFFLCLAKMEMDLCEIFDRRNGGGGGGGDFFGVFCLDRYVGEYAGKGGGREGGKCAEERAFFLGRVDGWVGDWL